MSRDRKDRLLGAAADAQKRNGMIPDSRAIDTFWQGQLEEADRRQREAPSPPPAARAVAPGEVTAATEIARTGGRLLSDAEVRRLPPRRRATKTEIAKLAIRRMRMLKWYPDWNQRLIDAFDRGYRKYAEEEQKRERMGLGPIPRIKFEGQLVAPARLYTWAEMRAVLDASSAVFGDWQALPRQKRQHFTR